MLAHRELLAWHTYVNAELVRVEVEVRNEHRKLARAWKRWDAHMLKAVLSKPTALDTLRLIYPPLTGWRGEVARRILG